MTAKELALMGLGAVIGYFAISEGKKWIASKNGTVKAQPAIASNPNTATCEQKWTDFAMTAKFASAEGMQKAKEQFMQTCLVNPNA